MKRMIFGCVCMLIAAAPAWAGSLDLAAELKTDVVLRALVDELERNRENLALEDLERPYFIQYALQDVWTTGASAELGAILAEGDDRYRRVGTEVRVGSYELDNTNFGGGGFGFRGRFRGRGGGGMSSASVPIEDDYDSIRQAIWWATDRQYKDVVETFEQKKAFMKSKMIEEKPNDFSREEPSVYLEERIVPDLHKSDMSDLARKLSKVFRDYPDVKDSTVTVSATGGNKYLVNTEGTRIRISGTTFTISVGAVVQAEDGMEFTDSMSFYAREFGRLPDIKELVSRTRGMLDTLLKVKDAPLLESYTGPVLFDSEPAAQLFMGYYAGRFAGGQRPVGSSSSPDDFENKIGKRILPKFVDVVDDATRKEIDGECVLGHYKYDDQGVAPQVVQLVKDGRLQAQVMSRNPSQIADKSTGHGRGAFGPSTSIACLIVSSGDGEDPESLAEELLEAAEDEDLEYGIRIARLGGVGSGFRGGFGPLEMYKVFADGHQEMVRGAEMGGLSLRSFKNILAVGDEPYVYSSGGRGASETVVAPAMLFEELDLAEIDEDFDKPPYLESPMKRNSK